MPETYVRAELQASDGSAAALRAVRWLSEGEAWKLEGDALPLHSWADRVLRLAQRVATDDDEVLVEASGRRILTELGWTEERARRAVQNGLTAVHDDQFADSGDTLRLILETARGPVSDVPNRIAADTRALLFAPGPAGWDMRVWGEGEDR